MNTYMYTILHVHAYIPHKPIQCCNHVYMYDYVVAVGRLQWTLCLGCVIAAIAAIVCAITTVAGVLNT